LSFDEDPYGQEVDDNTMKMKNIEGLGLEGIAEEEFDMTYNE